MGQINSEIPRLSLVAFVRANLLGTMNSSYQQPTKSGCIIVRSGSDNVLRDHIAPHRRECYLFFQLMEGSGSLTVGDKRFRIEKGEMAFIHPDEIMSWQSLSTRCSGHICLVHPEYFIGDYHVYRMFRQFPHFRSSLAAVKLIEEQEARLDRCMERLLAEVTSTKTNKRKAVLLHLQVILLEAQRGAREAIISKDLEYRHVDAFLTILDDSFQPDGGNYRIMQMTATEYAERLNVHPNYLNNIIKKHTGKTLREHIQGRLLYEAKTLLSQTDWDIKTISMTLGFSQHASFSTFFLKKENRSPSEYRELFAQYSDI